MQADNRSRQQKAFVQPTESITRQLRETAKKYIDSKRSSTKRKKVRVFTTGTFFWRGTTPSKNEV